jgi:hypothetical protein
MDPAFHFNAVPDPASHQSDRNLRPSRPPFVRVHGPVLCSVADPHHFDAGPHPDPSFHFDAEWQK